jgi:hypothetical protein
VSHHGIQVRRDEIAEAPSIASLRLGRGRLGHDEREGDGNERQSH